MATVIESKEKQLDVDSIAEYVRDEDTTKSQPKSYIKDSFNPASEVISVARALKSAVLPVQTSGGGGQSQRAAIPGENVNSSKPDVLETLWPGVHQDFSHSVTVKRAPSYYLTLGFMGGAVIALIVAGSFTAISSFFANYIKASSALNQNKVSTTVASDATSNTGVRVPLASTYEVQDGDTLAGIALQNYKHISPRLLDEICKANNLTDANVLSTGQKLVLPEYHY